jgi:hypothetical protein
MLKEYGNLDVLLLLVDYYSGKTKESDFVLLVDAILSVALSLLNHDFEGVFRKWLFESSRKIAFAVWIISYSLKEKHMLISKILLIVTH